jgi:clathrin heavy chain
MLVTQGMQVNIESVAGIFMECNRIQETTAFLLEALKNNNPNEGHLQTRLLEINILAAPNVAEAIFQMATFTHYDREKIARCCEQQGMYARALENYNSISDIRRCLLNTQAIPKNQLIDVFGRLTKEDALECLHDLMKSNRQQNV